MTRITGGWLKDTATQRVMAMVADAGHQVYFVGGCVRNALLERPVQDVDIATSALPEQVMRLASDAGLKAIPTGIDHGTVTIVADGVPHEITTFRNDIQTDGRRATVAYSNDISDDAARRDFTMNALYADREGRVFDPLNGLPDLQARKVRFIKDAQARITEDYLRILRFFRFHAWYGDTEQGLDEDALAAIAENLDGIDGLSKERVGAEMLKLLSAPDPSPSVSAMARAGVLGRILPGTDSRYLALLIHLENGLEPNAIRRLLALGGQDPSEALRLSKADSRRWNLLQTEVSGTSTAAELGYRHGAPVANDVMVLRAALMETTLADDYQEQVTAGAAQKFPIKATDLMPTFKGKALGAHLKSLEDRWIDSGFSLTREQLLG